jgi:multidrug efflux pump subunit AcrA (membrane-fusion protein)
MMKRALALLITGLTLSVIVLAGCTTAASTSKTPAVGQTVEVKKGDIAINVTSDGNLEMPNQFDLKFGTQGQVDQIFVVEGDVVKQGALLATLDSAAQINAIKNALLNIQAKKNDFSATSKTNDVSTSACYLPYNYPNLSMQRLMEEAQSDIDRALSYFKQGAYKDSGYWLVMTYFDIQVAEDLIKTKPNVAELAGAQTNSLWSPDTGAGSLVGISVDRQAVIEYLKQYRQKLIDVSNNMKTGNYKIALTALESAKQQMLEVSSQANSTVSIKNRMTYYYADTATSADFLQSAMRYVQELKSYIGNKDATPVEAAKKTYTAKLNLLVGLDVLQNQRNIFEINTSGFNWQKLQQYNLSIQSAEIDLYKAKQEIMKTAIIAPSDGMAVSVSLKKSYVLSAQDYSSQTAVKLVDTGTIRFTGKVDEIDIMKIKAGQKVTIAIDALPNKTFTGTVRFISPYGAASGNVIKFTVLIDLDPTDATLRGGLSATAEIHIASARGVLLVPVSAVVTAGKGSFVMVPGAAGSPPERRPVTIGIQNLEYVEVQSGLKEGEKVLIVGASNANLRIPSAGGGSPMRALR